MNGDTFIQIYMQNANNEMEKWFATKTSRKVLSLLLLSSFNIISFIVIDGTSFNLHVCMKCVCLVIIVYYPIGHRSFVINSNQINIPDRKEYLLADPII